MTAAALGAAICVAAIWVLFAITSLVALPPLPDSARVERVYLQPIRVPPPPPPPPPPRGIRASVARGPAPPPPPPR
jgi:hypothetical protein